MVAIRAIAVNINDWAYFELFWTSWNSLEEVGTWPTWLTFRALCAVLQGTETTIKRGKQGRPRAPSLKHNVFSFHTAFYLYRRLSSSNLVYFFVQASNSDISKLLSLYFLFSTPLSLYFRQYKWCLVRFLFSYHSLNFKSFTSKATSKFLQPSQKIIAQLFVTKSESGFVALFTVRPRHSLGTPYIQSPIIPCLREWLFPARFQEKQCPSLRIFLGNKNKYKATDGNTLTNTAWTNYIILLATKNTVI